MTQQPWKLTARKRPPKKSHEAGTSRLLFEGAYVLSTPPLISNYDVDAQGRFLMIKEEEREAGQINVVLNWFEDLKRLVPTD